MAEPVIRAAIVHREIAPEDFGNVTGVMRQMRGILVCVHVLAAQVRADLRAVVSLHFVSSRFRPQGSSALGG